MVKTGTFSFVFPYSWEACTGAVYRKYPNPFSTHVLSSDCIFRSYDPSTLTMRSTRLFTKTNKKPKWMDRWLRDSIALVVEHSVVDAKAKSMTTLTYNISLGNYMFVRELSVYRPSPEDPSKTECTTDASVTSSLVIGSMVERFGIERFKSNSKKAANGLLHVLENFFPYAAVPKEVLQKTVDLPKLTQVLKDSTHRSTA
eukprot:m.233109 g.233109  ORF g.233109 m.233109 type:complete len:200 (+) comp18981_c0_seq1:68-667(+)